MRRVRGDARIPLEPGVTHPTLRRWHAHCLHGDDWTSTLAMIGGAAFRYPRAFRRLAGSVKRLLLSHGTTRRVLTRYWPALVTGRSLPSQAAYERWISRYDTHQPRDLERIRTLGAQLTYRPLVSILLPVYNVAADHLRLTIRSVIDQVYDHWELCLADDASDDRDLRAYLETLQALDRRIKVHLRRERGHISAASNSALAMAEGEYIALLDHDDLLAPTALFEVVAALNRDRSLDVIYTDEDKIDADGTRFEPHFKSDWNLDLLYGQNFVSHLGVYRTADVRAVGGFRVGYEGSQDYDLVLRLLGRPAAPRIHHIPKVLYHWRAGETSTARDPSAKPYAVDASRRALRDHFRRVGRNNEVLPVSGCQHHRVRWELNTSPTVSVIVATRDRWKLLRRCVYGLLRRTDYRNIELIVVDNDSSDRRTLRYLSRLEQTGSARVIRFPGPFNFSAINNVAAQEARGDYLLFLNNDVEVVEPSWLTEMVSHLAREEVGMVGARLLYRDDTVQHAGVIIGIGGVAGHIYKGQHRSDLGYKGRAQLTQNLSAVTAACMLVKKDLFDDVGGFDEGNLKVAFNDVDLCLKIRELGKLIVWTPFATLVHHESQSRGSDRAPATAERFHHEFAYMQRRWHTEAYNDPYFNPNLSLEHTDIVFGRPRVPAMLEVLQHVA